MPHDRLGAADREDRDTFGVEIAAKAHGECLERDLIADPLDHDDRTRVSNPRQRSSRRLSHGRGSRQLES